MQRMKHLSPHIFVPQNGLEPPTYSLGGSRSIHLSYWGVICIGLVRGSAPLSNQKYTGDDYVWQG